MSTRKSVRRCSFLVAVGLLLIAPPGHSYDSKCYVEHADGSLTACEDGPHTSRHRWRGPLAEHTDLFAETALVAGIPASVLQDMALDVFTQAQTLTVAGESVPSLLPTDFKNVRAHQTRVIGVAEFAELPDFSYSLFDWSLGNETCPLDEINGSPIEAESCHQFKRHMGAANSNHFLPQAQHFFRYYHNLALERAHACKLLTQALPAPLSRFADFRLGCEKQALVLEAIAHHFLQDAWSSGHMWERWGSPDPRDYPDLTTGLAVALTSGIIHGVRGVVTDLEAVQGVPVSEVNDAMCAPHASVEWIDADGDAQVGLGDLYVGQLADSDYAEQRAALFSCAVSSMRDVYEAFGSNPAHGPLGAVGNGQLISVNPDSDTCFGQRVTNRAIDKGAGVDFTDTSGTQRRISLRQLAPRLVPLASQVFGQGLGIGGILNWALLQSRYRRDVMRIASLISHDAQMRPFDTNLAEGGMGKLLEVGPNSDYAAQQPLAPYVDPPLPWEPQTGQDLHNPASANAHVFHRAFAQSFCERVQAGDSDFDLEILRDAAAAEDKGSEPWRALCAACMEFGQRHVRVGQDEEDYDQNREPLCHYLTDGATQYIYAEGATDPRELAETWCGCAPPKLKISRSDLPIPAPNETACPGNDLTIPFVLTDANTDVPVGDYDIDILLVAGNASASPAPRTKTNGDGTFTITFSRPAAQEGSAFFRVSAVGADNSEASVEVSLGPNADMEVTQSPATTFALDGGKSISAGPYSSTVSISGTVLAPIALTPTLTCEGDDFCYHFWYSDQREELSNDKWTAKWDYQVSALRFHEAGVYEVKRVSSYAGCRNVTSTRMVTTL